MRSRTLVLLVLLTLVAGCVRDAENQDEIREKVKNGQYEEAVRLAHQYFADDKRILLVTLEYITDQKNRALKKAYRNNVIIDDVGWSTDASGLTKVTGRLLNRGNKTVTGFGIRAECKKDGKVVREKRASQLAQIEPGMSERFELETDGFTSCDQISVDVLDLGLKD